MIDECTDHGVSERPPKPGVTYYAFSVSPPTPGPVVLAIAHCERDLVVQDVLREEITIEDAVRLMKRYGISYVTGAQSDGDGLDVAHATMGAHSVAGRRGMQ
jgi:hypothetical protein